MDRELDTELIERVKSGDSLAFSDLDAKWRPVLFGMFHRQTRNRSDSEDLVQLTLFKVWERCQSFDVAEGTFSAWIFRIAKNVLIDSVRTKKRQIRGGGVEHFEFNPEVTGEPAESDGSEITDVVREVVASLPRVLRKPAQGILLNQSANRTADLQGLSAKKVSDRLKIAFDRMRHDARILELVGKENDAAYWGTSYGESEGTSVGKVQLSLFDE